VKQLQEIFPRETEAAIQNALIGKDLMGAVDCLLNKERRDHSKLLYLHNYALISVLSNNQSINRLFTEDTKQSKTDKLVVLGVTWSRHCKV